MIHGKMKNDEKNQIMGKFKLGQTKILIATSVIEVGIDDPNPCLKQTLLMQYVPGVDYSDFKLPASSCLWAVSS